jgi:SAM-dependent methyltransferase
MRSSASLGLATGAQARPKPGPAASPSSTRPPAAQWAKGMPPEEEEAWLADLLEPFPLPPQGRALEVGAGAGAFTKVLARMEGLSWTAQEPVPVMLAALQAQSALAGVEARLGWCDAPEDREAFPAEHFDLIASRQLTNGLHDPLLAFAHWRHWLRPGGWLLIVEGLFGREAWSGPWAQEVDAYPLAANASLALLPYLLERSGFRIHHVGLMARAKALSPHPRQLVLAQRLG